MLDEVLLRAAGALRRDYETLDWSATPLGPVSSWSPALHGAVAFALQTRFPVTLLWGPEFVMVYNEAYAPLIADKHPAALGAPCASVLPEAWSVIGPMMEGVRAGGGATLVEDAYLPIDRHGFLEECYWTFSYTPAGDNLDTVEGVVAVVSESTQWVIDRRRLTLLGGLSAALADLEHPAELPERALPLLRRAAGDLPAVDIRLDGAHGASGLPAEPHVPLGERSMAIEMTAAGERIAWFSLGPAQAGTARPVLVLRMSDLLAPDATYLEFLELIGATLTHALDRVRAEEARRGLSEALQRSLLTHPPRTGGLEVAVRYQPAAKQAQVGGDWYDAFVAPSSALTLVVGDVAGHDREAAAAMAGVRNVLRGIAQTLHESPAPILTALDRALSGLGVEPFTSLVLAQVLDGEDGTRTLRWANAGHPPPVLLEPTGRARALQTTPEPVVGVETGARGDHAVALAPGAVLVLYTDGLVERRDATLDARIAWLVGAVEAGAGLGAEELCDHLIGLLDHGVEDDVALLVLRVAG